MRAPPFKTVKKGARGDGPSLDPVAADIQDIPAVLSDIDSSWSDRGSLNYKSGQKLTGCLRSLLHRPRDEGASWAHLESAGVMGLVPRHRSLHTLM